MQGSGVETAQMAAQQVISQAMPQILGAVKEQSAGRSANPMGDMMVRLLEPQLQNMMGTLMSGFGMPGMGMMPPPGQAPPGQSYRQPASPGNQPGPQPSGPASEASKEDIEEAFND